MWLSKEIIVGLISDILAEGNTSDRRANVSSANLFVSTQPSSCLPRSDVFSRRISNLAYSTRGGSWIFGSRRSALSRQVWEFKLLLKTLRWDCHIVKVFKTRNPLKFAINKTRDSPVCLYYLLLLDSSGFTCLQDIVQNKERATLGIWCVVFDVELKPLPYGLRTFVFLTKRTFQVDANLQNQNLRWVSKRIGSQVHASHKKA